MESEIVESAVRETVAIVFDIFLFSDEARLCKSGYRSVGAVAAGA